MENEQALRNAAKDGDVSRVQILLAQNVKQVSGEMGDTPLTLAASSFTTEPKFVEVVRSLLEAGTDINHKNREGNSAIHNAAFRGSMEIVEQLVEHGADLTQEGELGMVPLGLAATKKHHAVVNILVKKLVEEKKFSEKQVGWMNRVENETQQLHIYRALTSIFREKQALLALLQFGVINAIIQGIKRFTKPSIQSSGLQLLRQCMETKEGLDIARRLDIGETIKDACKDNARDEVVMHLVTGVQELL